MSSSQRNKGANAEREVVKIFKDHGFNARRGMVFYHEPDMVVDDIPDIHFEIKRQEKIAMPAWIRQSTEACKEGESPCVIFRQNRQDWWIALPLNKWLEDKKDDRKRI